MTDQLDVIIDWVTQRGGRPVKATHIGKNTTLDLIEINFSEFAPGFFKEITWQEWYEVFQKNQLKFIYMEKPINGKDGRFYKLSQ